MLAALGAIVINADKIGHEAYSPHTETWREVVNAFGEGILLPDGEINRQKLGEIVFNDPKALQQLNQIMHPAMYRMIAERIEQLRKQEAKVVVLEAAVLLEANWTSLVDQVWTTIAPEATVMRRLCERSNLSPDQALARIRAQLPQEERIKYADVVIDTNCSLSELEAKVSQLWAGLQVERSACDERKD
jgi:dephospho-CoA kinase